MTDIEVEVRKRGKRNRFGFAGKAIYLDSDQLFRADVTELWNADANSRDGCCVWCTTIGMPSAPRSLAMTLSSTFASTRNRSP